MVNIYRYKRSAETAWDQHILSSKNGAFFFQRQFQEYHADRFPDYSFIFHQDNQIVATLPASRSGDEVSSHGGLTFGGLITRESMTTPMMLEIFDQLLLKLHSDGVKRFIYKSVPKFYHKLPADEDLYALTYNGARLVRRDVGSILRPADHPAPQKRRSRSIKKAVAAGVTVVESQDYDSFWQILETMLCERHSTQPAHTLSEIKWLHSKFPSNIRLFLALRSNRVLAGTVAFVHDIVVHTQYLASSVEGRQCGALDLVIDYIIAHTFLNKAWFSFGISTEKAGTYLNHGLIDYKEGFGARACTQDFYEIKV